MMPPGLMNSDASCYKKHNYTAFKIPHTVVQSVIYDALSLFYLQQYWLLLLCWFTHSITGNQTCSLAGHMEEDGLRLLYPL